MILLQNNYPTKFILKHFFHLTLLVFTDLDRAVFITFMDGKNRRFGN